MTSRSEFTNMLRQIDPADPHSMDHILPLVYDELRRLAQRYMSAERPGHTLSATALVHEAYLKLTGQREVEWQNRGHFFAVASLAMRRILVSHARARSRSKRGGEATPLALDEVGDVASLAPEADVEEILTVDQLLQRLAEFDDRATRVVECRYFAGLTTEETAEALTISEVTVKRTWRLAKSWLRREAGRAAAG